MCLQREAKYSWQLGTYHMRYSTYLREIKVHGRGRTVLNVVQESPDKATSGALFDFYSSFSPLPSTPET